MEFCPSLRIPCTLKMWSVSEHVLDFLLKIGKTIFLYADAVLI